MTYSSVQVSTTESSIKQIRAQDEIWQNYQKLLKFVKKEMKHAPSENIQKALFINFIHTISL